MKKLLSTLCILLTVGIVFGLTGCGNDAKDVSAQQINYTERTFTIIDKLTNNKNGVAGWTGRYDENGELIITSCYDKNRNPVSIELLEIEEVENEEPGKAA